MKPASLSASAIQAYEYCPSMYRANYIVRASDVGGSAAELGTACHLALQLFIQDDCHHNGNKLSDLMDRFDKAYWLGFSDESRLVEGRDILQNWWSRTDLLDGRKILSTEVKETFMIKTSQGEIPFNYIWDRCDELPDGEIEVVDYKSYIQPINPDQMKKLLQVRLYALAAAIKFPNAKAWWVSYDLLRYDLVGVRFTRDENIETWKYLKAVAERILADDGETETLNPNCRYCIRKGNCVSLTKHVSAGGSLSNTDPAALIDRRAKLAYASTAIEAELANLDAAILQWAESKEVIEWKTENTDLQISMGARRQVDAERAAKVLGPDLMARYGNLTMGGVDALLKDPTLDANIKAQLKALITRKFNSPSVKTKPLAPVGED